MATKRSSLFILETAVPAHAGKSHRRRAGSVLLGDGGGAELLVPGGTGGDRLHRSTGDPGGPAVPLQPPRCRTGHRLEEETTA